MVKIENMMKLVTNSFHATEWVGGQNNDSEKDNYFTALLLANNLTGHIYTVLINILSMIG